MREIPEVQRIIDGHPRMVQLGEETHARRHLGAIVLIEDLVGDIVHFDFLERSP
jgi:hypothetical protein